MSHYREKGVLSLCLRCPHKNGELCEDFLNFFPCKSGLACQDLFIEVPDTLNEF